MYEQLAETLGILPAYSVERQVTNNLQGNDVHVGQLPSRKDKKQYCKKQKHMSEINAPVIVRNEVSKTLTPTAFGKKSPNAGVPFFYPKLNGDTFESDVQWAGLQYILDVANKALRNTFAGLHLDHWNKETGQLNTEAWAADAADFTAGVTKLSDLKEEDYRLVDLIGALTDKASDENVTETETITLMQEIKGLSDQIREIRKQIKGIEAKYAERAAKRAATEAEKAPATA